MFQGKRHTADEWYRNRAWPEALMHCSNRSVMFTCSSWYSKWFTASYCCCSVVCLWLHWNKVTLLLVRLNHKTTLPLDVTSESSWLESLLCAELPVDLWRRAQCRFPAGFLVGQQILHWSLSPLWLLPLVWILGKRLSLSEPIVHVEAQ